MGKVRTLVATILTGFVYAGSTYSAEDPASWYQSGQQAVALAEQLQPAHMPAKNIILFVGDGMGISTVTAARILEGQLRGSSGEENLLAFEKLPYLSLVKTYNTNQQTPDSAGTMTAMMSGVKTLAGVIGVDQNVTRGDCGSSIGHEVETLLEQAEQAGKSTGVVTNTRITHATPAATFAHTPERGWESDRELSKEARAAGCKDIALQLLDFSHGDGLEVALGGGRRAFMPFTMRDPEYGKRKGSRQDGQDLAARWVKQYRNAEYVWNKAQFDSIDPQQVDHLLGLFNYSHMQYEYDREADPAGEPSLTDMTTKAIEILEKNDNGYFLMVESGRIDHAHHAGNAFRALTDTIEFARAVEKAMTMTGPDTLIIVTADHSHVLTIAGYPTRGNPILGRVVGNNSRGKSSGRPALADDGKPYTTLSYANGAGGRRHDHVHDADLEHGAQKPPRANTSHPDYRQEANVPLSSETHAGEDVAVYAGGPGAHLFHGVQEQHVVFHVMKRAFEQQRSSSKP